MVRVHAGSMQAVEEVEDPLPVILFSSNHPPEAFVRLVSELDIREVEFEVVHGVEADSKPALNIMRRYRDDALYVFCVDEVLDKDCAERLEATVLLSGLVRGRSVMSLSIDEYPIDSLASMLVTRAGRLARQDALSGPLPPPASVETLPALLEAKRESQSPFEVADGPLERPAVDWPLSRRASIGGVALLVLGFIGLSRVGDDEMAGPAESSAVASNADGGASATRPPPAAPAIVDPMLERLLDESLAVDAALGTRALRALDLLLIDPRPAPRGTLAAARLHCEELELAGLGDWRLPTLAELSAVGRARLIPRGHYWTETLGDAASAEQLVYDTRRGKMKGHAPTWKGARGVCVRKRSTIGIAGDGPQ